MVDPKHKQFLTNITRVPDKLSDDYYNFWENERKKAEYGLTVDGVFIHGWLYWHTQLWNIWTDEKDPINGLIKRKFEKAYFRDNEWIIADGIKEAEETYKGMLLFGSRRLGKSEFLASYVARKAVLFKGSENAVTGGNWDDIDIIIGKISIGLDALPEYFKPGRSGDNPRKAIELGFKAKKGGERIPWSIIKVRNFDNGLKTEAAAGITASSFVIDEIGKFKFAQCFEAAKPAFTSEYGWRCAPILTGTSGDIKSSSDAEKFFLNPEAHNFIVRQLKEEGNRKVSIFISGFRRMEGKYNTTLADYVQTEHGILVPKDSELHSIKCKNTDFKKAEAVIDNERLIASKSPDPTALLKATMYYPKNTRELFLQDDGNNFPIEAINEQIAFLQANPQLQGTPIRLYPGVDTKIKMSFNTPNKPLNDYPIKDGEIKDGAIVMYEPPAEDQPFYLCISGADPYNISDSHYSSSLGACYIYKRFYDPLKGTFQRRIVAEYVARPKAGLREFHENVMMLLEYYNAVCLPESAPGNVFVPYFDGKNKGYLLADGYDFLKEIHPKTRIVSVTKGLPPTVNVLRYYKELVYQYLTEEIIFGIHEQTGEEIKKLGVVRINSIGLLRELAAYTDEGNYDRYVAFGNTLAHEVWADKIYPTTKLSVPKPVTDPNQKAQEKPKMISPFTVGSSNPFALAGKGNPFGINRPR